MRARRCCLSVPARPARKLEKAPGLAVDEVVVDLEDSVPVALKEEARAALVAALAEGGWAAGTVSVRVNGTATPWFEDDVRSIASAGEVLDSVIVPKVEDPAELARTAELLDEACPGRERPLGLQALIESARGLRDVNEIAAGSERLEALILGPADMSVSLGFPDPADGPRWDFVRGAVLVAARATGAQAIDGPYLQIGDEEGLAASAARARELGFDGKWALHPKQVEPLERAFAPQAEEVAEARAILETLGGAEQGAALLGGEMVDEASRKRAEAVLARAGAADGGPR